MKNVSRLFLAAALTLFVGSAAAHSDDPRGDLPPELPELADRVSGGASLLSDIDRSRAADQLHEAAHDLDKHVGEQDQEAVLRAWQNVTRAWQRIDKRSGRKDPRRAFLLTHLETDLKATADVLGYSRVAPREGETESSREHLVSREICLGPTRLGDYCREHRREITMRIPRGVTHLRALEGEWRDFGRRAKAEILVNDRIIWTSDVAKSWDVDSRRFDLEIPPRSHLTVRSSNGVPFEIRRLDATWDTSSRTSSDGISFGDLLDELNF